MNNIHDLRLLRRVAAASFRVLSLAGLSSTFSAAALAATDIDQTEAKTKAHDNVPGTQQGSSNLPAGATQDIGHDAMKDMDHGKMPDMHHEGMENMPKPSDKGSKESMGEMRMAPMQGGKAPSDARDPDAYADGAVHGPMRGMDMADDASHAYLLLDKFEVARERGFRLDAQGWYGGDRSKLWLEVDGERQKGKLGATRAEALWDRTFATYWSSQLGVRHDFGEGPGRNWAALGVQGLAPYWFEAQATLYAGESGRTAARVEFDYELFITQRLALQPNVEANLYGKNDRSRHIGSGLSEIEAGLRLRYEISRQFAPYIGVSWRRKFGNTASFARAAGEEGSDTKFVAGVRVWF